MRQDRATKSIFSKIIESASVQLVNFLVGIVLARILSPADYGIYSILLIFVNIGLTVVQGGFNSALIQRKEVDKEDYSTVFVFSLFAALIIYIVLFIGAPLIAKAYRQDSAIQPLRVISLVLFPNALYSVVNARVAREMDFPFLAKLSVVCVILTGCAGIILAYSGAGIWALVVQQILTYTILPAVYCVLRKWKPGLCFKRDRFKPIVIFSSKILFTDLINSIYAEIQSIIIGISYNAESLAFFSRGQIFPRTIMSTINSSVQAVLFPVYSDIQDDKKRMGEMLLANMKIITFIVYPMIIGLFAVAEPLIKFLLTEKWIGCIHFLRVYCVAYLFWPLDSINLQALKATGNGTKYLTVNILKKIIAASVLLLSVILTNSVETFAYSAIIIYITDIIVGASAMKKEIGISIWQELGAVAINTLASSAILLVMLIPLPVKGVGLLLLIQIAIGVLIYIIVSMMINRECMNTVIMIINKFIKNR